MRSPRTATAPFSITRRDESIVTTQRALQTTSAGSAKTGSEKRRMRNACLQERSIEWPRKKAAQPQALRLAGQVRQDHLNIPAELPQDLPASSARGREVGSVGGNRNPLKFARALGDCLEHRHAFG